MPAPERLSRLDAACEICDAEGVELVRVKPPWEEESLLICRNCQADVRDAQQERPQP